MKRITRNDLPYDLDPEFDVLLYEDRRDVTDLKFWYNLRQEAAAKYRRIRNGLGAFTLLAYGGEGYMYRIEHTHLNTPTSTAVGVGAGLLLAATSIAHMEVRKENAQAIGNAEIIAGIFERSGIEPPAWTVEQ